jgi:hypothetical protein
MQIYLNVMGNNNEIKKQSGWFEEPKLDMNPRAGGLVGGW